MDIAKQEGIEAEEEALHIIAQKADGALRDALSTFDRVVSFSGKNLTRKAVTENLNVLDYDTYFEITDLLLDNNIPQLLLHFNTILSRGFDAHHFVAGLASHFRDLMVSKNAETISLLEVGDQTKKKYHAQAQKTPMDFLLKALEIANDCDLKYRTSRNPRLLVELCLMQLASITFDGEKKKPEHFIIGPNYFKEQVPFISKDELKQEKEVENPPKTEENVAKSSAHTETQPQQESTKSEEKPPKIGEKQTIDPKTTSAVSGFSLKGMQRKKEILERQLNKQTDKANLPKKPFTEIAMQAAWKEYVDRLQKKGEKIMASTLETDTPTLEGTTIHLEFPNHTMRVELERAQHSLLEYLKRKLSNYDIDLSIKVNEQSAKKFAFTPREKYEKMLEANPHLELLLKTFDLDL